MKSSTNKTKDIVFSRSKSQGYLNNIESESTKEEVNSKKALKTFVSIDLF